MVYIGCVYSETKFTFACLVSKGIRPMFSFLIFLWTRDFSEGNLSEGVQSQRKLQDLSLPTPVIKGQEHKTVGKQDLSKTMLVLQCIQAEFINFICINDFNYQDIFNSTSSIQVYTEKYLAFENHLFKYLVKLVSCTLHQNWNPSHLDKMLNCPIMT